MRERWNIPGIKKLNKIFKILSKDSTDNWPGDEEYKDFYKMLDSSWDEMQNKCLDTGQLFLFYLTLSSKAASNLNLGKRYTQEKNRKMFDNFWEYYSKSMENQHKNK